MCLEEEDYLRVHLPGYMQILNRTSCCCNDRLDDEAEQYKSIYLTNDTVEMAKLAASSLCRLVDDVVRDKYDNGFAVIRPPGHHAEPGYAGGYCFINNVAVAASYAIERLLIHRFDNGNFFPFSKDAGPRIAGNGDGEGRNVNVGWNDKRMGDDEYLVVFEKLLMPIATEFDPDLVLVSAGFDAAKGDMGDCNVTPECFSRLTRQLKTLAGGKVVCALEGGYVRSILCKCVESVVLALLDGASDDKFKDETKSFYKNLGDKEMLDCIDSSAAKSIRETILCTLNTGNASKSRVNNVQTAGNGYEQCKFK
ncbi:histone deacetylase [Skeletonema marinoi]|uniref:histone deacetylase n=1 Tax=Skeletonema marinoi TaxID=267567 RepID=A0AAD8YGY0_9STRA|nr:histone deacetylase [Skeletonema marinoi]